MADRYYQGHCIVPKCSQRRRDYTNNVTFHPVPKPNGDRKVLATVRKWIEIIANPCFTLDTLSKCTTSFFICSNHFQEGDFLAAKRRILSDIAVPTVFPAGHVSYNAFHTQLQQKMRRIIKANTSKDGAPPVKKMRPNNVENAAVLNLDNPDPSTHQTCAVSGSDQTAPILIDDDSDLNQATTIDPSPTKNRRIAPKPIRTNYPLTCAALSSSTTSPKTANPASPTTGNSAQPKRSRNVTTQPMQPQSPVQKVHSHHANHNKRVPLKSQSNQAPSAVVTIIDDDDADVVVMVETKGTANSDVRNANKKVRNSTQQPTAAVATVVPSSLSKLNGPRMTSEETSCIKKCKGCVCKLDAGKEKLTNGGTTENGSSQPDVMIISMSQPSTTQNGQRAKSTNHIMSSKNNTAATASNHTSTPVNVKTPKHFNQGTPVTMNVDIPPNLANKQVNATPANKQVNATPANKQVDATPANKQVNATPANKQVNATPANKQVNATPANKQVNATPANRLVPATPAHRLVPATPANIINPTNAAIDHTTVKTVAMKQNPTAMAAVAMEQNPTTINGFKPATTPILASEPSEVEWLEPVKGTAGMGVKRVYKQDLLVPYNNTATEPVSMAAVATEPVSMVTIAREPVSMAILAMKSIIKTAVNTNETIVAPSETASKSSLANGNCASGVTTRGVVAPVAVTRTVTSPDPDVEIIKVKPGSWIRLDEYYYGKQEGVNERQETGEFRFKCFHCQKMLYNNVKMMLHMRAHIDSEKQQNIDLNDLTQCKHCFRQFDTPFEMQTHVEKVHQSNKCVLVCRICEKDHPTHQTLTTHMRTVHKPCEMPYVCQICMFRSSVYDDIIDHFSKKHNMTRQVLCFYCLKVFSVSLSTKHGWGLTQNYYQHLQRHQAHSSCRKCSACKLVFVGKNELKIHKTMHHSKNQRMDRSISNTGKVESDEQVMIKVTQGKRGKVGTSQIKSLNVPQQSKIQEMSTMRIVESVSHLKCVECSKAMSAKGHYKKYIQCSLCRFATCCSNSYSSHMLKYHAGYGTLDIPLEHPHSEYMYCSCGFRSRYGNTVAHHLVFCNKSTCFRNRPAPPHVDIPKAECSNSSENPGVEDPPQTLFTALGLKRKNSCEDDGNDAERGSVAKVEKDEHVNIGNDDLDSSDMCQDNHFDWAVKCDDFKKEASQVSCLDTNDGIDNKDGCLIVKFENNDGNVLNNGSCLDSNGEIGEDSNSKNLESKDLGNDRLEIDAPNMDDKSENLNFENTDTKEMKTEFLGNEVYKKLNFNGNMECNIEDLNCEDGGVENGRRLDNDLSRDDEMLKKCSMNVEEGNVAEISVKLEESEDLDLKMEADGSECMDCIEKENQEEAGDGEDRNGPEDDFEDSCGQEDAVPKMDVEREKLVNCADRVKKEDGYGDGWGKEDPIQNMDFESFCIDEMIPNDSAERGDGDAPDFKKGC